MIAIVKSNSLNFFPNVVFCPMHTLHMHRNPPTYAQIAHKIKIGSNASAGIPTEFKENRRSKITKCPTQKFKKKLIPSTSLPRQWSSR